MMTEERNYLCYLAGCGARKETAQPPDFAVDWSMFLKEAAALRLDSFVKYAIMKSPGLGCPEDTVSAIRGELLKKAAGRMLSAKKLQNLQETWRSMGIESAVMKGQAIASAYGVPELRSGCDIDLYVDEKDEKKVYRWAEEQGHKVNRRIPGFMHGEIIHKELGMIELHVACCGPDEQVVRGKLAGEYLLVKPERPFVTVQECGAGITTLDMTEHMMFIVTHMINHYLHGEATPRMILDVSAFFTAYRDQMDLAWLWKAMEAQRYDRFLQTVFGIGICRFGFRTLPEMRANCDSRDVDSLLDDFCSTGEDHEEIMAVYDAYCNGVMSSGISSLPVRLKILLHNAAVAVHLMRTIGVKEVIRMGKGRVVRMLRGDRKPADKAAPGVEERLEMVRRLGLME